MDGTGNGVAASFSGAGFGTRTLRALDRAMEPTTPEVVSRRGVLRGGLPAVYQDSDFAMRFVGALEEVLDPIAATLDSLHHLLDPDHAPRAFLDLLCAWLGVEGDEDQAIEARRDLVRRARELSRSRGPVRGLALALGLAFPDVVLRVEDEGGVTWRGGPTVPGGPPRIVVYCDTPVP